MPRDGSGSYTQPFPNVVEGTTIESAVFNGNTADVVQDLNTPRPIVAGGTGANNARDAMIALNGEIANQQVTNYDTHPFVGGSFWSTPGATNSPADGGYYSGIATVMDANHITLEARQYVSGGTGGSFTRQKQAGVWQPWQDTAASYDARFVNANNPAGDTMTGLLQINHPTSPELRLNATDAAGGQPAIEGLKGGFPRWVIVPGQAGPDGAGDSGGDFFIGKYRNDGTWGGIPFSISRASGDATFNYNLGVSGMLNVTGALNVGPVSGIVAGSNGFYSASGGINLGGSATIGGTVTAGAYGAAGVYYFGNSGTRYLQFDGTNYILNGGQFIVNSNIYGTTLSVAGMVRAGNAGAGGTYYFGSGDKYLTYDGANFSLSGGSLYCPNIVVAGAGNFGAVNANSLASNGGGLYLSGWGGNPEVSVIFLNAAQTRYIYSSAGTISFNNVTTIGVPALDVGSTANFYGAANFHSPVAINNTLALNSTVNFNSSTNFNAGNFTQAAAATFVFNNFASTIANAAGGSNFQITGAGGGNEAFISFHRPGAYGVGFGLASDNRLWTGGWSLGVGTGYRIWDTRDFNSAPVLNSRLAYAADRNHALYEVTTEPYLGAVITGASGLQASNIMAFRYRWMQILVNGSWITVGAP